MSLIRKLAMIALFGASTTNAQIAIPGSHLLGLKLEDINSYITALDSNYRYEASRDAKLPIDEISSIVLLDTLRHMHKATATSSKGWTEEVIYSHSWLEFSRLQDGRRTIDMILVCEYDRQGNPNPAYIVFYSKDKGIEVYDMAGRWNEGHFRETLSTRRKELDKISR